MKTIKCLECGKISKVGKKLRAKYTCPCCNREYVVKEGCSIAGQE